MDRRIPDVPRAVKDLNIEFNGQLAHPSLLGGGLIRTRHDVTFAGMVRHG
jgi:hypothetical protein